MIAQPYSDTASLASFRSAMATRWAWNHMLYGGVFTAVRGANLAALEAFGTALNDPHLTVQGITGSPTPVWAWAANYAGAAAVSLRNDPGIPLQTLALDVLPGPAATRLNPADRNALLYSGISTHSVDPSGTVRLETCVTTYQRDGYGDPDDSYLYVERMPGAAHRPGAPSCIPT